MTNIPPPGGPPAGASPDARVVADAIQSGWIGRGFKLGIGFFLAGLVIWLIPMMLLVSCVGGIAALAGGAALSNAADVASAVHLDDDEPRGDPVEVEPATDADRSAAAAAVDTAAADAADAAPADEP